MRENLKYYYIENNELKRNLKNQKMELKLVVIKYLNYIEQSICKS